MFLWLLFYDRRWYSSELLRGRGRRNLHKTLGRLYADTLLGTGTFDHFRFTTSSLLELKERPSLQKWAYWCKLFFVELEGHKVISGPTFWRSSLPATFAFRAEHSGISCRYLMRNSTLFWKEVYWLFDANNSKIWSRCSYTGMKVRQQSGNVAALISRNFVP